MFAPALPTTPGMEIKVTPDRLEPIIPNAIKNHGDFRFARKKLSLLVSLLVKREMIIKKRKYAAMMERMRPGLNCVFMGRK